jgi:hypothetical protein
MYSLQSLTDLAFTIDDSVHVETLRQLGHWRLPELQYFRGPRLLPGVLDAKNLCSVTVSHPNDLSSVFEQVRLLVVDFFSATMF